MENIRNRIFRNEFQRSLSTLIEKNKTRTWMQRRVNDTMIKLIRRNHPRSSLISEDPLVGVISRA